MFSLKDERLSTELDLLEAMYPGQVTFTEKSRELKFVQQAAALSLRLPDHYPESGFPDIILANDASKNDLRNTMREAINGLALVEGEESLDAVIARFQDIAIQEPAENDGLKSPSSGDQVPGAKTVVIWLHHLLATSKRKLALSPALPGISGITKPGYPGVMIFSGPAIAVNEHVNALKQENWQAFQVRHEEEGQVWEFAHMRGIKEVETMGEVVKSIEFDGAVRKDEFLKAVGIK
ncbi:hypothetical protein AOQ84DRAFT_197249 [Glonium stellatum]|uniref:RWD domain-containing protein n=1 Tax=Glonium stellatum TaxID=574774 RepID=A0A8E2FEE3_9PEZI|nr:hypothetical protein AOQ84DRAFT_197249 [Glonium stellatum]